MNLRPDRIDGPVGTGLFGTVDIHRNPQIDTVSPMTSGARPVTSSIAVATCGVIAGTTLAMTELSISSSSPQALLDGIAAGRQRSRHHC